MTRTRAAGLYLVFKIVQRLSRNWRALNAGQNLTALVSAGAVFRDGVLQQQIDPLTEEGEAA